MQRKVKEEKAEYVLSWGSILFSPNSFCFFHTSSKPLCASSIFSQVVVSPCSFESGTYCGAGRNSTTLRGFTLALGILGLLWELLLWGPGDVISAMASFPPIKKAGLTSPKPAIMLQLENISQSYGRTS